MSESYATRDQFFAAPTRRYKDVEIAGMKFRIRSLTEGEWSELQLATLDLENGGRNIDAIKFSDPRLIVAAVVDAGGEPVFTATDVARLSHADAGMTEPLVRAIRRHCGLVGVEESKKNLGTTGEGDSPSSSSAEREPQGAMA
jgi:hypothetical protein